MKNIRVFLSETFHFLLVKCSVYLNRLVFVMYRKSIYLVMNNVEQSMENIIGPVHGPS